MVTTDELNTHASMIKSRMVEIGVSENIDNLATAAAFSIRHAQKRAGGKASDIKVSRGFAKSESKPTVIVTFSLNEELYDWAELATFEAA